MKAHFVICRGQPGKDGQLAPYDLGCNNLGSGLMESLEGAERRVEVLSRVAPKRQARIVKAIRCGGTNERPAYKPDLENWED